MLLRSHSDTQKYFQRFLNVGGKTGESLQFTRLLTKVLNFHQQWVIHSSLNRQHFLLLYMHLHALYSSGSLISTDLIRARPKDIILYIIVSGPPLNADFISSLGSIKTPYTCPAYDTLKISHDLITYLICYIQSYLNVKKEKRKMTYLELCPPFPTCDILTGTGVYWVLKHKWIAEGDTKLETRWPDFESVLQYKLLQFHSILWYTLPCRTSMRIKWGNVCKISLNTDFKLWLF